MTSSDEDNNSDDESPKKIKITKTDAVMPELSKELPKLISVINNNENGITDCNTNENSENVESLNLLDDNMNKESNLDGFSVEEQAKEDNDDNTRKYPHPNTKKTAVKVLKIESVKNRVKIIPAVPSTSKGHLFIFFILFKKAS